MNKILLKGVLMLVLISCKPSVRNEKTNVILPVIPQPKELRVFEGFFSLDSKTQVVFSSEEQKKAAHWFNKELENLFGLSCQLGREQLEDNSIVLVQDTSLANEAYLLDINAEGIVIKASSEAGYFYAFQTILQLVPISKEKVLPSELIFNQLVITDQPRFKWRGAMLDISRHFFGPEAIKKLIDQMAAHKMNRLHLHLTDDTGWRIEIKEYPKLHEIGSVGDRTNSNGPAMYLTEEEARDITSYANERQIMIVPEVDVPGHSGAIERAYPEFSGGNNTLNIANEHAIKMIETVILRLSDIFNTRYVHFGGDEVRLHDWEARPEMRARMDELNIKDQHEFEGWFDRRMADFIVRSGLNPVAWDEASDFNVNKETILQWWRGEHPEILFRAAESGYEVILSPVDYIYLDYSSDLTEAGAIWEGLHNGPNSLEAIYHWNPIPKGFNDTMSAHIIGIEAGIWTEFISDEKRLEYMIYPRLSAVAEKAWTHQGNLNWKSFQDRLSKQYVRYEKAGVNYRLQNIGIDERKIRQPEAFMGPINSSH
ncbi:beta-N-acetylhexosaminidase [Arenibacter sp. S6351L]|uniref:beta-N-acetylhexosaminidase n=1 Tax=Arenibacter sp. S6351L TaxID=2926407 RepID=UPI001FF6F1E4|nr:beta-N-acetylhexosaminidase [Arenibacter sp. S6351L]MCK0136082.1 beta-N-acetylhexosaminidase [Arenibacter sp. S6351L]